MDTSSRRRALGSAALVAAALAASAPVARAQSDGKMKVVFQVSDADPAKWKLTLNNARNVVQDLGEDKVEIEIVAYGPGIAMLKRESTLAPRIAATLKSGAKVVACENTMHGQKLTYDDMLPNIGYVPAGVVELMKKQYAGWAYIRP
jgi:intracellular sulfur oxidation DsrE/DsrF family protein